MVRKSQRAAAVAETRGAWQETEIFTMFNWIDRCLIEGLNFQDTITEAMTRETGTTRRWDKVLDKLRSLLRWKLRLPTTYVLPHLLQSGTKCIKEEIPKQWIPEINKQRASMGIPLLGEEYIIKGDKTNGGLENMHSQLEDSTFLLQGAKRLPRTSAIQRKEASALPSVRTRPRNAKDQIPDLRGTYNRTSEVTAVKIHQGLQSGGAESQLVLEAVASDSSRGQFTTQRRKKSACTYCWKKKLGCDKSPTGCERCKNAGVECTPQRLLKRRASQETVPELSKKSKVVECSAVNSSLTTKADGHKNRERNLVNPTQRSSEPLRPLQTYTPYSTYSDQVPAPSYASKERSRLRHTSKGVGKEVEEQKEKACMLSAEVAYLMRRLEAHKALTPEEQQRLRSIHRTIQRDDVHAVVQKLTEDSIKAEKSAAWYKNMAKSLLGNLPLLEESTESTSQPIEELAAVWEDVCEGIRVATGIEHSGILPAPEVLGAFACHLENFMVHSSFTLTELSNWFRGNVADSFQNWGILQPLMTAILCREVFANCSFLFDGEYCNVSAKLYSMISAKGGLEAVRNIDQQVTKLLLGTDHFRSEKIEKYARYIAEDLESTLLAIAPSELNAGSFYACCKRAIDLKLMMLISPMDFQIFFSHPGDAFNSTWMKAVDLEGCRMTEETCVPRKVRLCMFPAITQRPSDLSKLEAGDVDAALLRSKPWSFQMESRKNIDGTSIVAKAVVVIE